MDENRIIAAILAAGLLQKYSSTGRVEQDAGHTVMVFQAIEKALAQSAPSSAPTSRRASPRAKS